MSAGGVVDEAEGREGVIRLLWSSMRSREKIFGGRAGKDHAHVTTESSGMVEWV